MKKLLSIFLALAMATSLALPVMAADSTAPNDLPSPGSEIVGTRHVIGTDDRVKVSDNQRFATPYKSIVFLELIYNSGEVGSGTGFFISDDTILTAAHNLLYLKNNTNRRIKSINVYFNCTDKSNGVYSKRITTDDYYLPDQWTGYTNTTADWKYDYAIIRFNGMKFDSSTVGWFGSNANYDYLDRQIHVTGYPSPDPGTNKKATGKLYTAAGSITGNVGDYRLVHTIDATAGESGSPVYYIEPGVGPFIVGIYNADNNLSNPGSSPENYAVKYTLEIRNWVKTCTRTASSKS